MTKFKFTEKDELHLDNSMAALLLILLILFLSINGFFSMAEIAMAESHRGRLEKLQEEGHPDAAPALIILENPDRMLPLAQAGITLSSILTGLLT